MQKLTVGMTLFSILLFSVGCGTRGVTDATGGLALTGATTSTTGTTPPAPAIIPPAPVPAPDPCLASYTRGSVFAPGGDGSVANPFVLCAKEDLDLLRSNLGGALSKNFILGRDIDLSNNPFAPIGKPTTVAPPYNVPFTGMFDGNGHSIRNLSFTVTGDAADAYYVGLFGFVGNTTPGAPRTIIKNLTVTVGTLAANHDQVGGLAGQVANADIDHVTISPANSTSTINGRINTGGMVGALGTSVDDASTLNNSTASVVVTAPGYQNIGGLVGSEGIGSSVVASSSTGSVNAPSSSYVGGLVGQSYGTITKSFAHPGALAGYDNVGGLAGYSNGAISVSYSITDPGVALSVAHNPGYIGGLVGFLGPSGSIVNSYSRAEIKPTKDGTNAGGLVGYMSAVASVDHCYASAPIDWTQQMCNGLAYVNGSYVPTSFPCPGPGGLIGTNFYGQGTITASYWDKTVTGRTVSDGGTGMIAGDMKTMGTYIGWDFVPTTGVWDIAPATNASYPFLQANRP